MVERAEPRASGRSSSAGFLWRQRGDLWILDPDPSSRMGGTVEFIGGSGLASNPQLSYRRLLEALAARGWRIHAWSYLPALDHQEQANAAWRAFRMARNDTGHGSGNRERVMRLGHSLGCKLQLLAPDGGRACSGVVSMSFNNFSAERSIPLLAEMGQQFRFRSEFSPSPEETLRQVASSYQQPRNLLVRFRRDNLDQSSRLLGVLQARDGDDSRLVERPGDHLMPASAGLRRQFLGDWADDPSRQRQFEDLADTFAGWI